MANIGYMQVVRHCNHYCRFCSNPSNGRIIDLDRAKATIDEFVTMGYDGLILTGGEPTLFPELPEVIRYAIEKKLPPRMITNGSQIRRMEYLRTLYDAGLRHVHLSFFSNRPAVEAYLTQIPDALQAKTEALENMAQLDMFVNINVVINKYNSDHLSEHVRWLVERCPRVAHIVFNGLEPLMMRPGGEDTIPRPVEYEVELNRALTYLRSVGRTFRVERVPLCYMTEFAECSTETRKLVKGESRAIYFLDQRDFFVQNEANLRPSYGKVDRCRACTLNDICIGLYKMDIFYSSKEISPVFVPKEPIVRKILSERE